MRFGEICRLLPNSSPKMIKQQLKLLEDNEIVKNEKEVFNNTTSSTYYLSEKGKDLATIVLQMKLWGQRELDCTNLKIEVHFITIEMNFNFILVNHLKIPT